MKISKKKPELFWEILDLGQETHKNESEMICSTRS